MKPEEKDILIGLLVEWGKEKAQLEEYIDYQRNEDRIRINPKGDITFMDLSGEGFEGVIPESIGNLTHLRGLVLSDNKLTGVVPESIGNLTHLINLELRRNQLEDKIPSSIGNLTQLEELLLDKNQFTHAIPGENLRSNPAALHMLPFSHQLCYTTTNA